jgi:hypothetical protein
MRNLSKPSSALPGKTTATAFLGQDIGECVLVPVSTVVRAIDVEDQDDK